jgi:hypothetical protein
MFLRPRQIGQDHYFIEKGFFWIRIFGALATAVGLFFAYGVIAHIVG